MILSRGAELAFNKALGVPIQEGMAKAERNPILRVLEAARWRVAGPKGAAERLGLRPTTLESRRKKLGIGAPGSTPCRWVSGTGTPDLVCGDAAGDLR